MSNELLWWAYRHTNGTIQVKRYFDDDYRQDCAESPYVKNYTTPFGARSREEAVSIAATKV